MLFHVLLFFNSFLLGLRHQTLPTSPEPELTCYFCGKTEDDKNSLHLVTSFRLDNRVRKCAKILNKSVLYARLQQGDMIAQDVYSNCISGICISPDRLRDISTAVGNSAIEMFEQDRVVYPIGIAHGCFTVGAVDNIDVLPPPQLPCPLFTERLPLYIRRELIRRSIKDHLTQCYQKRAS